MEKMFPYKGNQSSRKLKYDDITEKIIGSAFKVFNTLGFGFLESIYKRALVIELSKRGLIVQEEKPLKVYYDDQIIGEYFLDLLVGNEIVLELKSVQKLVKEHEVQLVNYFNGLKKEIGLLINFGPQGVEVKWKYRNPIEKGETF